MKSLALPALVLLVLPLGCSGGSRSSVAAVEPTPLAAITIDNAVDVARAAARSSFDLQRVVHVVLGVVFGDAATPPATAATSWTVAGPFGGEAIVSLQDRDASGGYSSGDGLSIAFVEYGEQDFSLAGTVVAPQLAVRGDPLAGITWSVATALELRGLRVTTPFASDVLDAVLRVLRERREILEVLEVEAVTAVARGPRILAAGAVQTRYDYVATLAKGQSARGAVDDAALGGRLEFATKGVMTGILFLPDPGAGVLQVAGAGGSALEIEPVDFFNLDVRVDADGDGVFEHTLSLAWQDLGDV
jgi:hypothetical protein